MIEWVKDAVRAPLVNKRINDYYKCLDSQFMSYHDWINKKEKEYLEKHSIFVNDQSLIIQDSTNSGKNQRIIGDCEKIRLISYSECSSNFMNLFNYEDGLTVFTREKKDLSEFAVACYLEYMSKHQDCVLCYGDEDEWNSNQSERMMPWLKPDYSPDLLLQFFYFGNSFVIRNRELSQINWLCSEDPLKNIYDMCLQISFRNIQEMRRRIGHIPYVTNHSSSTFYFGKEAYYENIKECYSLKLRNLSEETYIWDGNSFIRNDNDSLNNELTSIIIPSKNHPEVLEKCLKSIHYFSKKDRLEIIIVDNGSDEELRKKYEDLKLKYKFNYIYSPQEFNFSAICNQGAKLARGKYLLFLNDDIEVRQSSWLLKLKQYACRSYVAAVGAKLCYPESKLIQHSGITNLLLGPVHKLQFLEDRKGNYHMPEFWDHDVLAVTAACLMIRREIFLKSGGFSEELAVAFNDVEFCFRLYKMGYYNVICNEFHLWHHESLSRGSDEAEEKQKRLLKERKKLYCSHYDLYGKDPFYHPLRTQLILDTNMSFGYEYPYKPGEMTCVIKKRKKALNPGWENECLMISLEYAGDLQEFLYGERACEKTKPENAQIYIQGYAFILETDNSMFDFFVVLEDEDGRIYESHHDNLYRTDLNRNLPEDYYADLNGFGFVFDYNALPKGKYRIGVLARSAVSRQRLYRFTGKYLNLQ